MYMLFGKKEDKNKLPDLPSPRGNYGSMQDSNSLPSFPDSPSHNRFSQAVIKDAVSTPDRQDIPTVSNRPRMVEMKEWSPSQPSFDDEDEMDEEDMPMPDEPPARMNFNDSRISQPPKPMTKPASRPQMQMNADVFVRIDKFNHAKKALTQAQESLEQIDELIKKIRETKLKEDQELSSWENDILHVKSRIKEVTETVFEKLE